MNMVAYWIDALIQMISNFINYTVSLEIIKVGDISISLGQTSLYFAIAFILLSFVFKVRINSTWFREKE